MSRGRRPVTISLAMIVKNEEAYLARCLASAREFVDEIVIVDTGSTDSTKEIALAHQARIADFVWNDDFAEARNAALAAVSTDWVLQMDADEELLSGGELLRDLIRDRYYRAYYVNIVTAADAGSLDRAIDSFIGVRIFRRSPGIKYHNSVHEEVKPIEAERRKRADVRILHFGPALEGITSKPERNIPMIKKVIESDPENVVFYYYLGNEYFGLKDYVNARRAYEHALKVTPRNALYFHEMLRNFAWCFHETGGSSEAAVMIRDFQKSYPDYTDLYFVEGEIAYDLGEYRRAMELFNHCLKMGDPPDHYFSMRGAGSWRAEQSLARTRSAAARRG